MRGAWLCTILVVTACNSPRSGQIAEPQNSRSLTATPTSGQTVASQPPLAIPTPLTRPTVEVSPLPAVPAYQLARVPNGYSPPVDASYSIPSVRILEYLPKGTTSEANGERISVLATSDTLASLTANYEVIGNRSVRGGKAAIFFRVQGTAHPRQALAWVEHSGLVLAVYGRKTGSDLALLASHVVRR
ncbi:MAG: hypothetical protein JWM40_1028 [Frankiales bacterium]|nr:hypothetical protein [Frankiales bacterium]